MSPGPPSPEWDDEPATRGGPALPPPASVAQDSAGAGEASGDPSSAREVLFAGPVDDPDRYALIGLGISGGEGTTWRARYRGRLDSALPLAVKLLRPPVGAGPDWPSAADRQRWLDQAALLRHLRLDHLVRLYEVVFGPPPHARGEQVGTPGQSAYLVMEWVEGETLHAVLHASRATAATIRQRLGYVAQAATTLAGLLSWTRSGGNPSLHRDVKPTNCIVNDQRGLVLIDVSTMRLVNDGVDAYGLHTREYTAPEVLRAPNAPRTAAADVYAVGALTVFCLWGDDPPPADTPGGADRVAGELRAVAQEAGLRAPDAFVAHIMAALDPDPARRPSDLIAWSHRLRELASKPPRLRDRWVTRLRSALRRPWTRKTGPASRARSRRSLMLLAWVCLLTASLIAALTVHLWPTGQVARQDLISHMGNGVSTDPRDSSAPGLDATARPSTTSTAPAMPSPAPRRHLAVVAQESGEVDVFWTSADGSLEYENLVNGRWLGPERLGAGTLQSDPAATISAPGTLDVFWVGGDHDLWHLRSHRGAWSAPEDVGGGPLTGSPAATGLPDGAVDVFWKGANAALWHKRLTGTTWGPIEPLGNVRLASDPVATAQPSGTIDVFWRAADGAIGHQYLVNGVWSDPQPLGSGLVAGPPVAIAQPQGPVDVFWKDADGGLGHEYYTAGWYGPAKLGGSLGSDPYAVSAKLDTVDVFWKGIDAHLWRVYYADGAWHSPVDLGGGPLGGAPVAAAQPNGIVDVFWRGTNGHLFHKRYNGSWANAQDLGGDIN